MKKDNLKQQLLDSIDTIVDSLCNKKDVKIKTNKDGILIYELVCQKIKSFNNKEK